MVGDGRIAGRKPLKVQTMEGKNNGRKMSKSDDEIQYQKVKHIPKVFIYP
jgi:hypothetical protein